LSVTLDSALHRDSTVENDIDQSRDMENIGDGARAEYSPRECPAKRTLLLNKALARMSSNAAFLSDDKRNLCKLSGEKKTVGMLKVYFGVRMSISEKRGRVLTLPSLSIVS